LGRPDKSGNYELKPKRAAWNEAGLKQGLLNKKISNDSSLEWSTPGESEDKLDTYKRRK